MQRTYRQLSEGKGLRGWVENKFNLNIKINEVPSAQVRSGRPLVERPTLEGVRIAQPWLRSDWSFSISEIGGWVGK